MSTASTSTALAFRHRFEGPFFRELMLGGIKHIPSWLQRLTMPLWGGIFYLLLSSARRAVLRNLAVILGPATLWEAHRRGWSLFRQYAQMITDTYKVYLGSPLVMEVESLGRTPELLRLLRERGGILATGHIGMWQVGPLLNGWQELPPFYMARAEEPNPLVQQWEQKFREHTRTIYTSASPFSALALAKVLRERCVVGMQIDRVLGDHTVTVNLCGRRARFPAGPALLSRVTQVPLVPSFFVVDDREGTRRLVHHVGPAIFVEQSSDREADIRCATQQLAAVYEQIITRYPTQWYQFFDFFDVPEDRANHTEDEPCVSC